MTLVSPGYNRSTLINQILAPYAERNIEFKGLNRKDYVEEGEMTDMRNLSSDRYPYLAPRKLRGAIDLPDGAVKVLQLMPRFEKLAMIAVDENDDVNFYYDGEKIDDVTGLSTETYMVAINTKICFFPEKTCLTISRDGTIGGYKNLDLSISSSGLICNVTPGENYDELFFGNDPADNPDIQEDDAIDLDGYVTYTLNGTTYSDVRVQISAAVIASSQGRVRIPADSFLGIDGTYTREATNMTFHGTAQHAAKVERVSPDLDIVIEWNNRLWGANNADNTIYASKLGDPTNWKYYQGTNLDSYYAEQGTDGIWTGAAVYSTHLIFFKEASMCRIYGTAPANYQISNTDCYGVEKGSRRSVVVINDKIFYKSAIGIMCYQGGTPYLISEKFNCTFKNVVAGTEGTKYYASIHRTGGRVELMVLDVDKAVWHKEDETELRSCATVNNRLYYSYEGQEKLYCSENIFCSENLYMETLDAPGLGIMNPAEPTERYPDIDWMAQFGPFDEYVEERKIYSKLALRFKNEGPCYIRVYISINEGEWELVKDFSLQKTGGEMIPIVPRRCDRYSIKIIGRGNCEIKSLTRRYRQGTHGKL